MKAVGNTEKNLTQIPSWLQLGRLGYHDDRPVLTRYMRPGLQHTEPRASSDGELSQLHEENSQTGLDVQKSCEAV